MEDKRQIYCHRKEKYGKLLEKQNKIISNISILRMIIFICAISLPFVTYCGVKNSYLSVLIFLAFVIGFIFVALKHDRMIKHSNLISNIYNINIQCIERIDGKWKQFKDDGEEYKDQEHPYSNDLDIFGPASLFQYINDTTTYMGRQKLKNTLTNIQHSEEKIYKRQEAITELADKIAFRQRLKGEGTKNTNNNNIKELLKWSKSRHELYEKSFLKVITVLLPALTLGTIIYYFLGMLQTYYVPASFIIINIIFLRVDKKEREEALDSIYAYKKKINDYYNMLRLIEKTKFKSDYLKELKQHLIYEDSTASQNIKKLNKISDVIQDRKNIIYFILNYIFLWDYHCMINLEKWKKINGEKLEAWFNTIGSIEELSSLSIVSFDNPDWCIPNFIKNDITFKGEHMGHPLLGKERVCNDLTIKNKKVILITGSNMSGKSTFLRTAGINLVLAYTGAPVCAKSFKCNIMEIFTCMRISDNLEKNISSFYGELIRIKELVNKVKEGRKTFFLLDEIFKGTNSIDRHTGAKALINKLTKEKVLGMVSTHDLELGSLEKENSNVKNYHFEEYYKNNNIHFDYKLKNGISTTRNAIYLMEIAGIIEKINH